MIGQLRSYQLFPENYFHRGELHKTLLPQPERPSKIGGLRVSEMHLDPPSALGDPGRHH